MQSRSRSVISSTYTANSHTSIVSSSVAVSRILNNDIEGDSEDDPEDLVIVESSSRPTVSASASRRRITAPAVAVDEDIDHSDNEIECPDVIQVNGIADEEEVDDGTIAEEDEELQSAPS